MIIYNTTFHVEDEVHDMFIFFIRNKFVPQAADSGLLSEPRLAHIYKQHSDKGRSYSLQFRVKDIESLNQWVSTTERLIQEELIKSFGHKVAGFVTLMEEVDLDDKV